MKKEQTQLENLTNSRAFRTFLPFLLLAYIIWALSNLAETHIDTVSVWVDYKNFPQDKQLISKPKKALNVEVETSGFNILKAQLFKKNIVIDQNKAIFTTDTSSFISTKQYLTTLQDKYNSSIKVLRISPDTLRFDYKQLFTKTIPIKLKTAISYKKGYNTIGKIKFYPKSLEIFGTKEALKNLDTISTTLLKINDLSNNINQKIALVKQKNIKYSLDSITIKANIDQMLIDTIKVSYQLKNTSTKELITFPKKVIIRYKSPVKGSKSIKNTDFKVICDFKANKDNQLIPKLIKKPKNAEIIAIEPQTIQYLIKK